MNKKISQLTEYVTPATGDYLAVVDTANGETKKIDFVNFKGDTGAAGTDGTDGASIITAEFSGDDILFTKDDETTVTLDDAKITLKGATGANGVGAIIKLTTATAAATASKTATLEGYTPATGDVIALTLTNGNTAASMTLNINGAGAIAIHCGGLAASALTGTVTAGGTIMLYYDGTVFVLTGATRDTNTNTTYSEISEAEIAAGTASTARTISGRRAAYILGLAIPEGTAVKSTGETGGTKFLREDGDGTCSWQTPSYPTRDSLGLDTDDSPQFTAIELGHASDTTIARVNAGVASIEGKNIALNGTGETFTTGTIELGASSDTTLSRSAAGVLAVEGVVIPSISSTNTLTNKRITQRVVTATDDATAEIDCDVTDQYQLTAVANNTTFTVTGTPTNGQKLIIRLKDAGAGKTLTWNAVFRAIGVTLPTTTVANKTHYIGCVYNSADSKWDVLAVGAEA